MSIISAGGAVVGAGGAAGGYEIERSLRFNSADSAYLNRTFGTPTDGKKYTYSGWVKRLDNNGLLLLCEQSNKIEYIQIGPADTVAGTGSVLSWRFGDASGPNVKTTAVYRDVSAWYHIVVAYDSTQATASNRIKLYVNGSQVTDLTASYPSQNTDSSLNRNGADVRINSYTGTYIGNGYLTEINFIDGSALDPTSFGEFNSTTGVWQPIEYTGSYGTNGFYLNFSDNSSTTTLGDDLSGNGNDWTTNNFSVTAGAGNDSLVDTPTPYGTDTGVGGEVRGNYATLNPLSTTAGTYTQGNLRYVGASSWRRSNATLAVLTGKWYWEVTLGNAPYSPRGTTSSYNAFGFGLSTVFNSTTQSSSVTDAIILADNGYYKNFSGSWTDGGTAFSSGDTLAVAVDLDANTFTFYRNNTQITTGTIGGTAGRELVPIILSYDGSYGVMDCNFGQRPFAYTAPSGFKALVTTNLPTPTIEDGGEYFNTVLYTGTGSSLGVTGVGFQPDWVWIKERSGAADHGLYDVLRGVQNQLESNTTTAETAEATGLTAFGTDGFTVGALAQLNTSGDTYVAWNWKANGAGVSNTAGTITSTVSVNTTSGFSIVTYTGTGSNATVGHGLGVAPSMVIVKARSGGVESWYVWQTGLTGGTYWLLLNATSAQTNDSTRFTATPTSTVINLGSNSATNGSGYTYVAYCFAPVAGYSAFGSYTGNNSADGPFVYTGFRPRYILFKDATNGATNWVIQDTTRFTYNLVTGGLLANTSASEYSSGYDVDILSNGFKIRRSGGDTNASGATIIYMAFAENPFKYSLAR